MADIRINMAGEEKVVGLLKETAGRVRDLRRPLADLGERLVRKIGRGLSGRVLKVRSGRLRGSLMHHETPHTLTVSAGGGDEVRYARIHHKGGIIRPKDKQYLTIPFPGGPADKPVPLRARDFKNTFVAKGIIFQKKGKGIVPVFFLRKSVTMPARPYMDVDDSDIQYLQESVADYIAGKWK